MQGKATEPLARRPPPPSDASRRGVAEPSIVAMLTNGGFPHLLAEGRDDEARGLASEALDRWVAAGLAHEIGPDGQRRFDPAEVVNGFKWAGLQERDSFWREHWIATGRRLSGELALADAGWPVQANLVRTFDLGGLAEDAEILLRAPVPLAGPDHAVRSFAPSGPPGARIDLSDGRLTARLKRGALTCATLSWSAKLEPGPAKDSAALSAEDAELYLRQAEGPVQVTPRIRALAEDWAAGRSGWEAAVAFRRRLGAGFCLGVVGYEAFEARSALDWVLDHGWFDCLLGSALLVSLCRARGIPARLVGGHFLYPLGPTNHSWAEVWADGRGWTPIDLAGWDLSAGDADAAWRDAFVGRVDCRLVTERPPRRVTGPMSLRLPLAWRMLQVAVEGGGVEISLVDAGAGRTVFSDSVRIALGPAAAAQAR